MIDFGSPEGLEDFYDEFYMVKNKTEEAKGVLK